MSAQLWQYFLQDDVERFRQVLASAGFDHRLDGQTAEGYGRKTEPMIGSPANLSTSPRLTNKARKGFDNKNRPSGSARTSYGKTPSTISLTRADVNSRDNYGRTLLHLATNSGSKNALGFVRALLGVPFLDLYVQDLESGWTALHRALYFGNIGIAQALMQRDIRDVTDYTTSGVQHNHAGGLIKIKDHEGNSPFEVFGQTVAVRDLRHDSTTLPAGENDTDSSNASISGGDEDEEEQKNKRTVRPRLNLNGDEVFTFGSNKNLTLGLGDESDRAYPERLHFSRPQHLLHRFYEEQLARQRKRLESLDLSSSQQGISPLGELPAIVLSQRLIVQDVIMSKLHSAVITNDPEANLFMCGFGPGGRLGLGGETTRFRFVCVESGGLVGRKVISVALGQDHSIAISHHGEVFSWGSNKHSQLGYALPKPSSGREIPIQNTPRQLFGVMKKELVIGAAASAIHSMIFTATALYAFGKNEGQLGLVDADARSLEYQVTPRRVGVSLLQSPIQAVSAIDRATTVLLESHDVIVFTHYGWTKVLFPLEGFTNYFLRSKFSTRYDAAGNYITKITSNGDTICALSSFGEVFTVIVGQRPESGSANVSTTNPTKAKNALPTPNRVWSIKKAHMAARDVAVGQGGSIILCTDSGSVWRKEKRAKVKGPMIKGELIQRPKDYKFVRVPSLTRAVAVRTNGYGAFSAVRKDSTVIREQIFVDPPGLWRNFLPLLSFSSYQGPAENSDTENPQPRFWAPAPKQSSPASIRKAILFSEDVEGDMQHLLQRHKPLTDSAYNIWIASNVSDVRIPAHSCILAARSSVLRSALVKFGKSYYFAIPEFLAIEYGKDGQVQIQFPGADFLTLLNLVFYMYTESIIDVWHHTRTRPQSTARFRQVRSEVMKIASRLDMKNLERAARVMTEPSRCLLTDMEHAFWDEDFYQDADMLLQLAGGAEVKGHTAILCPRCPFFEGLFHGRAGGKWLAARRGLAEEDSHLIEVDLKHVDLDVFNIVLRHLYADTGEELFDDVVTRDLDEFTDLVIEVMSVANELMIDRLAQICQKVLGEYVTTRNVCHFLNAVSPCSVNEFKQAGLEYICLNLEAMLENRLLDDLDEDLLADLDEIVQANQHANLPFVRSGRADGELFEQYPQLPEQLETARQVRIDSMRLQSRLHEDEERSSKLEKFRVGSFEKPSPSPGRLADKSESQAQNSPKRSPSFILNDIVPEVPFEMDEDQVTNLSQPAFGIEDDLLEFGARSRQRSPRRAWSSSPAVGSADSLIIDLTPSKSPLAKTMLDVLGDAPPQGITPASSPALGNIAWSTARMNVSRVDLKDIMAQASTSRQSNLSIAMNAEDTESKGGYRVKLSQKERKKQLQRQEQEQLPTEVRSHTPGKESAHPSPSEPTKSPWQAPPGAKSNTSVEVQTRTSSTSPRPMTLRQTLAGTPSNSTPGKSTRAISSPAISSSKAMPVPTIQSIRHIPPHTSSSYSATSSTLASIVEQQHAEKAAIREAATARRSLQDIQTEQEFQEWWDKEEAKVKEETRKTEEANARTTGKGRRARGRGTSKGQEGPRNGHEEKVEPKNREGNSRGRVRGRARQDGRGRVRVAPKGVGAGS